MSELLSEAQPVVVGLPKRPSHNQTVSEEPLTSYGTVEHAGEPHKGKIGEKEPMLVQGIRMRSTSGLRPIDQND